MQWAASAEKQPSGHTRVVQSKADGAGEPRAADQSTWDFTFCKTPASVNNVKTVSAFSPHETAAKKGPTIAQILWKYVKVKNRSWWSLNTSHLSLQITAFSTDTEVNSSLGESASASSSSLTPFSRCLFRWFCLTPKRPLKPSTYSRDMYLVQKQLY